MVPGNSSVPRRVCTRCRARTTSPIRRSPRLERQRRLRADLGAGRPGSGLRAADRGTPCDPGEGASLGAVDLDVDFEQRGIAVLAEILAQIDANHVVADLD